MTKQPLKRNGYLHLFPNGDPFGSGFTATETEYRHDDIGIYRGDIGPQTRAWWRVYASRHGYVLVEWRD